jgi:hypothetical protein
VSLNTGPQANLSGDPVAGGQHADLVNQLARWAQVQNTLTAGASTPLSHQQTD